MDKIQQYNGSDIPLGDFKLKKATNYMLSRFYRASRTQIGLPELSSNGRWESEVIVNTSTIMGLCSVTSIPKLRM
jgi:hypothetical protein